MRYHGFGERLAFSEGVELDGLAESALLRMVPEASGLVRATVADDRNATDYWVRRRHGLPPLSIDVKHRSFCPIERWSKDDACIETTSVYQGDSLDQALGIEWTVKPWLDDRRQETGWTLNGKKRTDYVMYTWPNTNGLRFWIVPFHPLCSAARISWRAWAAKYEEKAAPNRTYLTLSVFVPRHEIARAMRAVMVGVA